jgi:uncharacterized protein
VRPSASAPRRASVAALVLAWLLAFCSALAAAQDLVAVPKLERRVTDLTGTLSAEQIATLDQRLAAFERTKGSQIAVLMVPTTKPETIEQYGIRVADAWKVGRAKVDDGLILIVAKNDQRLRIEVGYGLEGVVPDAVARRVIREIIAPHFLAGDFYGGINDGVDRLIKLIEGEPLPPPPAAKAKPQPASEAYEQYFVILLVFTVIVGGVLTRLLGRFFGATATGGIAGGLALLIAGTLFAAIAAGLLAFVFSLLFGGAGGMVSRGRRGGWGGPVGGWGGGSWGGGGGGGGWSGGGWSGGGGGFGGGGASGSWGD